jgi:hypothetical protein
MLSSGKTNCALLVRQFQFVKQAESENARLAGTAIWAGVRTAAIASLEQTVVML